MESQYHIVGIGVSIKNNLENKHRMEFFLLETMSDINKVIKDETEKKESIFDHNGNFLGHISRSQKVEAFWLNNGSNRITPPTIYRGETVEILQYGDTDEYFWRTMHYESGIRGKEVAIWGFSNLDRNTDFGKIPDRDHMYYFKIDTINKLLGLFTAKNDNERTNWIIGLDTKVGRLLISDNAGTLIKMWENNIQIKSKTVTLDVDKLVFNGNVLENNISSTNWNGNNFKVNTANTVNGSTTFNSSTNFNGSNSFNGSTSLNGNASTSDGASVL